MTGGDVGRSIKTSLSSDEVAIVVGDLTEIYLRKAGGNNRHNQALGFASNIAGLHGMTWHDVKQAVQVFFEKSGREPDSPGEIDGIVRFAMQNASNDPFIPEMTRRKIVARRVGNVYEKAVEKSGTPRTEEERRRVGRALHRKAIEKRGEPRTEDETRRGLEALHRKAGEKCVKLRPEEERKRIARALYERAVEKWGRSP